MNGKRKMIGIVKSTSPTVEKRLYEAIPLWRPEDLVPSIIKW
jgi:hypothetical protein